MLCPVCSIELKIPCHQNVEVDTCPKCRGVWLDRGELDKIIARTALDQVDLGEEEYANYGARPNRKRSVPGDYFNMD